MQFQANVIYSCDFGSSLCYVDLKGARDAPCSAQGTVPLTGGFLRSVSTLSSTWGKLLFWGCYITTWGKDKPEILICFSACHKPVPASNH